MPELRTKPNKIIFLGGVVLFFCLNVIPAFAAPAKPVTIQGKILDASTKQGIFAASVSVYNLKREMLAHDFTDNSGNYLISLKVKGRIKITVAASKYQPQTKTIKAKPGRTKILDFSLVPSQEIPLQITAITPSHNSTFYENDTVLISPTVKEPKPDYLKYQFSIDGIIKQSWSTKSNYSWNATFGSHRIKAEVRAEVGNNMYRTASTEITIFVYRKPLGPPS